MTRRISHHEIESVEAYLLVRGFSRGPAVITGLAPVGNAAVRLGQNQELCHKQRTLDDSRLAWVQMALIRSR